MVITPSLTALVNSSTISLSSLLILGIGFLTLAIIAGDDSAFDGDGITLLLACCIILADDDGVVNDLEEESITFEGTVFPMSFICGLATT